MKILSTVGLLLALACNSTPPAESCTPFHTGKFEMKHDGKTYHVTREDSLQMEIQLGRTDTSFAKIHWKNACEYEITFLPSRELYTNKDYLEIAILNKWNAKIIATKESYCVFEFYMEGVDKKFVDTLVKLQ